MAREHMEPHYTKWKDKKVTIILNPISGGESRIKKEKKAEAVNKYLKKLGCQVDIFITKKAGDETRLASEAIDQGVHVIFSYGGDGTTQKVLGPIVNAHKDKGKDPPILGVIPGGAQNLLAEKNHIPKDPIKAVKLQLKGDIKFMDVGRINGNLFLLLAGINYDGKVVYEAHGKQEANKPRPVTSPMGYARLANSIFEEVDAIKARITVDDELPSEESLFLGWISNTTDTFSSTLTRMDLRPEGKYDDGKLELTVLPKESRFKFARETLFAGMRHFIGSRGKRFSFGTYTQGSKIKIETGRPVFAHVDGSPLPGCPTELFNIETLPNALKVFQPKRKKWYSLRYKPTWRVDR